MGEKLSDEAILASFEAFMLSGSKSHVDSSVTKKGVGGVSKKKKGRKSNQHCVASPVPQNCFSKQDSDRKQYENQLTKMEKQCWRNFHAFCDTVQLKWLDIDDQLSEVLFSIEDIRKRLPTEMKLLSRFERSRESRATQERPHGVGFLLEEDVQLALSHDLLQHEKMSVLLRRLISDLAESLQMMGRQLDNALQHYFSVLFFLSESGKNDIETRPSRDETSTSSVISALTLVDDMRDLFNMLSRELFRKQCLSMLVLDSLNDNILQNAEAKNSGLGSNGQLAISLAYKEWSRESKASCVNSSRLRQILEKSKQTLD